MTYRHAQEVTLYAGTRTCGLCYLDNVGCTTPTPDPASPCGWPGCQPRIADLVHSTAHAGCVIPHPDRDSCHPHTATLCQSCGHALEADHA